MFVLSNSSSFFRLCFFSFTIVLSLFSFGGEGLLVAKGQWNDVGLTAKNKDNWSVEHCFKLEGRNQLSYYFRSDYVVTLDLHLHPETPDERYLTEYLAKVASKSESGGSVVAPATGTYCFDFIRVDKQLKDNVIHLKYKVD